MAYTAGAQKSVLLYSGLNPQVVDIMEDDDISANGFYDGDLVSVENTGQVILAVAAQEDILGIARTAATGTDNTPIAVELLDIHSIYVCRVADGTTTTEAYIGDCVDFVMTAGAQYVATGGTTDAICVGIHPVDGLKSSGRILIRFRYNIFKEQF